MTRAGRFLAFFAILAPVVLLRDVAKRHQRESYTLKLFPDEPEQRRYGEQRDSAHLSIPLPSKSWTPNN